MRMSTEDALKFVENVFDVYGWNAPAPGIRLEVKGGSSIADIENAFDVLRASGAMKDVKEIVTWGTDTLPKAVISGPVNMEFSVVKPSKEYTVYIPIRGPHMLADSSAEYVKYLKML